MNLQSKNQGERLQKALARIGKGSRREIETWIKDGRIQVNARIAELGFRVQPTDIIKVDGKKVVTQHDVRSEVIIYNKPEGQICTRKDDRGRESVFDSLPKLTNSRWISIGRLDYNTSGLLLFTTSGELAYKLMHPSFEFEREYLVRVYGRINNSKISKLKKGIELEEGLAKFHKITPLRAREKENIWYKVVLKEGKYREVRRLFESVGCTVSRLKRIRYGNILLPRDLKQGECKYLTGKQINSLV